MDVLFGRIQMRVLLIKMHMFSIMKYERKSGLKVSAVLKGVNVIFQLVVNV